MTQDSAVAAIRPITGYDLDRIVALDRMFTGRSRRGFFEKRLAAAAREPRAFVSLAAGSDGAVGGYTMAHLLDGEFGGLAPVAVLDTLGVDPNERGRGAARRLMVALEAELANRGVREIQTQAEWKESDLLRFFAAAGFELAPRLVMIREIDGSAPEGEEDELRDSIPVRSLTEHDLPALIGIDRKVTGRDRSAYYKRKVSEALNETGIRVSLVAETDGQPSGFVMARVDYGEFGRTSPSAAMDTIGINPDFGRRSLGRALMSQLLANLASLRVERVHTQIDWNNLPLLAFLQRLGFLPSQRLSFSRRIG